MQTRIEPRSDTHSSPSARSSRAATLTLVGALGLLAALLFSSPGMSDVPTFWLAWMRLNTAHDVVSAYRLAASDYPPLSHLMLAVTGELGRSLGFTPLVALKVALSVGLLITCAIAWNWTRRLDYTAMLGLALVVPTLGLGYIDIFFAPALLISLWTFSERRYGFGMAFFILAVFIKWQPLIFAPFIFIFLWRNLPPARALLLIVGLPVAALLFSLAVYGNAVASAWGEATSHSVFSGNALNVPWLFTFLIRLLKPSLVGPLVDGRIDNFSSTRLILIAPFKLLFASIYLLLVARAWKINGEFTEYLKFAIMGFIAYFMFNTGVHENHLFAPLLTSAALFYLTHKSELFWFCAVFLNLNCVLFYGLTGKEIARVVGGLDLTLPATLALCVWGILLLTRSIRARNTTPQSA